MNAQLGCIRLFFCAFSLSWIASSQAALPDCQQKTSSKFAQRVCDTPQLNTLKQAVKNKYLNAQLMSNAPLKVLDATQQGWLAHVELCKSTQCIVKQFNQRVDDLELFTSMNHSLSQFFVRQSTATRSSYTQLQLHQLEKNRIKIEGMQYRNPNNSENSQIRYLRAYTSPDQLAQIVDVESKCTFSIVRTGHLLKFSSKDHACQYFTGLYRLYD